MKIVYEKDTSILISRSCIELSHFLSSIASKPTLLLLSGGSSLSVLHDLKPDTLRLNLSLGLVDERFTNKQENQNGRAVLEVPFVSHAIRRGIPFISIDLSARSVEEAALNYERCLREWRKKFPSGIVVAMLGLGEDGHTAGILPYPERRVWFDKTFVDTSKWVVGYDTRDVGMYQARISVSLRFLKEEVEYAIVYVCGKEKEQALQNIIEKERTLPETPGLIFHEMKDVHLFTNIPTVH